ncbi:MAG: hypothetical protein ACRC92_27125 [Peptostreptococcaceae bacterium]
MEIKNANAKEIIKVASESGAKASKLNENKITNAIEVAGMMGSNFPKKIKSKDTYVPESLDAMLVRSNTERQVVLNLTHTVEASLIFDLKDIKAMIMSSVLFNPVLTVKDRVIIPSKFKLNSNSDILVEEGETISENIIEDIVFSDKDSTMYILLNNRLIIGHKEQVNTLDALPSNEQARIIKGRIPEALFNLRTAGKALVTPDMLTVGRVKNNLAIPVSLDVVFETLILPKYVRNLAQPDYLESEMDKISFVEAKRKLAQKMKVSSVTIKGERMFVAFKNIYGNTLDTQYALVIPRKNFGIVNLSYKNSMFEGYLKSVAQQILVKNYILNYKGITDGSCNLQLSNIMDYDSILADMFDANLVTEAEIASDERLKVIDNAIAELTKLNTSVFFVATSNFSGEVSATGKPINEEIKINSSNNPLYLPVVEINKSTVEVEYKSAIMRTPFASIIANSNSNKPVDHNKVITKYRQLLNGDVFLKQTDYNRIVFLPNLGKIALSLITPNIGDNIHDMGTSCVSTVTDISFVIVSTDVTAK